MALLSFHPLRWKVWTPCRNRVHPQRGGPRVRERNRGGRGSAAKAADCPDQTSRRTPKGLQLERPPFQHQWGQDRHLSPQHTCPLSLVSALTESVDAPHFSSTKAKKKQNKKQQTLLEDGVCGERGDGMRWLEGDGWESHTHTHHILWTTWGSGRHACLHPTNLPSFSARGVEIPVPTQAPVTYRTYSALIASPAQ